jgi:hypothetical protein
VLTLDRALQPHLPALMALLDLPVEVPDWAALTARHRWRHTREAARRLLLCESQNQPLILAFEDLTGSTLEPRPFSTASSRAFRRRVSSFLVNYRPEYQHGWGQKIYPLLRPVLQPEREALGGGPLRVQRGLLLFRCRLLLHVLLQD